MEDLRHSYTSAKQFPQNLICPRSQQHVLKSYREKLEDEARRLFCAVGQASLHVFYSKDWGDGFRHFELKSRDDLHDYLIGNSWSEAKEPPCRLFFVHAPNSRAPLKLTYEMFTLLLTYYQVMPAFLDFIFPFGDQINKIDSHFAGFRYEHTLGQRSKDLQISSLGRSGLRCQQSYSLKSIEKSRWQPDWPWVIRQTSVYHSFDLNEGVSTWIIVKANALIRERFANKLEQQSMPHRELDRAFALALESHLIPCEWASEKWRWYLNYLESRAQKLTGSSLTADPRAEAAIEPSASLQQRATWQSRFSDSTTKTKSSHSGFLARILSWPSEGARTDLSAGTEMDEAAQRTPECTPDSTFFKIKDIQDIQYIQENADEARLVLVTNSGVIAALRDYFQSVWNHTEFPHEIKIGCAAEFAEFNGRLKQIQDDLAVHIQSVDAIISILSQRKNLINDLIAFRMAEQSKESSSNVEAMTELMSQIATRTERETVTMKVISVVTLIFLPMTFVSKTLMSTDIVKFNSNDNLSQRNFSPGALVLFIVLSFPLMIATVAIWRHLNKRAAAKVEQRLKMQLTNTAATGAV